MVGLHAVDGVCCGAQDERSRWSKLSGLSSAEVDAMLPRTSALVAMGTAVLAAAQVAAGSAAIAAERLPSLAIDVGQTTVSGLSSGAFMALQFHVAFSGTVRGAGVVAGGPPH